MRGCVASPSGACDGQSGPGGARTLAEGFARLEERGVIDARTAERLARAVGLRNVVAHGYAAMSVDSVYEAAGDGLADLESFAEQVSAWTEDQATS